MVPSVKKHGRYCPAGICAMGMLPGGHARPWGKSPGVPESKRQRGMMAALMGELLLCFL